MSPVVWNNRGFLQLLADCSPEQFQLLQMTATPQQMHALVQVILNVLHENLPFSEEERRKLIQNKDAILNLALPDIPYKTKKQTLIQEGGAFTEDLLAPVLSSLLRPLKAWLEPNLHKIHLTEHNFENIC